jgi:hypothetical protein
MRAPPDFKISKPRAVGANTVECDVTLTRTCRARIRLLTLLLHAFVRLASTIGPSCVALDIDVYPAGNGPYGY